MKGTLRVEQKRILPPFYNLPRVWPHQARVKPRETLRGTQSTHTEGLPWGSCARVWWPHSTGEGVGYWQTWQTTGETQGPQPTSHEAGKSLSESTAFGQHKGKQMRIIPLYHTLTYNVKTRAKNVEWHCLLPSWDTMSHTHHVEKSYLLYKKN